MDKKLLIFLLLFSPMIILPVINFFGIDWSGINLNLLSFLYSLFLLIFFFNHFFNYVCESKKNCKRFSYVKKLNEILIKQSHNNLFYQGKVSEGAKELTKQVVEAIDVDRCSIWVFTEKRNSIKCQQLYSKSSEEWSSGFELLKKDFESYFEALITQSAIVADDAFSNPSTSCFKDSYLVPIGIKSMLDVPIVYRGETIGVICMESFTHREWCESEIDFSRILSSLYSFAFSIKEEIISLNKIDEMNKFIDEASLISKADSKGKITYVNHKFTEVSGYSLQEVLGKDHNIVSSGVHSKEVWKNMYKTVIKDRKIWNMVVTNKNKNGNNYYVDSYIKAEFDPETDKLLGFVSIRQDVTEIVETLNELDKKNTYLEHAAKILRHDMHSGINTYIPRGISSLERRLPREIIEQLKIESPLKMIKDGLKHTQKVYRGVYEFTNLVKKDAVLTRAECSIKNILSDYLSTTAYVSQVILSDNLPIINVNEALFCTAVDNLIRNGLKYNDSETKWVKIYSEENYICVEDNGRGIDQNEFIKLSKPYARKEGQKESGSGLGLNISIAILQEHGFSVTCDKLEPCGTKIKIKIKQND